MLKLLIVEDEVWEREGLVDYVNWEDFGIELAGTACDGFEGIEKAREIKPDIIITDIKMPGMDGLKMSRIIREFLPNVKIIILTGYDDFKFAKEAISINTHAYILKPIDDTEFREALCKVIEECRNDAAEKEKEQMLKKLMDESVILSRKNLLNSLLREKPPAEMLENPAVQDMMPAGARAAVIAVGFLANTDTGNDSRDIEFDLDGPDKALKAELKEAGIEFVSVVCESGTAFFVLGSRDIISEISIYSIAEIIVGYCERKGFPAAAGIGAKVDNAADLHYSCRQAKESLNFALFWKERKITEYSAIEAMKRKNAQKIYDFLTRGNEYTRKLMNMLRGAADISCVESLLDEMFRFIKTNLWLDKNMVVNFLYGLLNEVSLLFHDINIPGGSEEEMREVLPALPDYQALTEHVRCFFRQASELITERNRKRDALIVEKVEQIIKEKYNTDISLKTIAAEVYLSPNYLGSIFKKHTGITINDYLCRLRMEKAKELLKSPKNKVSKVAKDVGIPNVSYFCQVFKDMFGVAPGKYQEMVIRGN